MLLIVVIVVDIVLGVPVYLSWKSHRLAWRHVVKSWHYIFIVLALLLMVVATALWLFMLWYTFDWWRIASNPSLPKPYLIMILGPALMVCVFLLGLVQLIHEGFNEGLKPRL